MLAERLGHAARSETPASGDEDEDDISESDTEPEAEQDGEELPTSEGTSSSAEDSNPRGVGDGVPEDDGEAAGRNSSDLPSNKESGEDTEDGGGEEEPANQEEEEEEDIENAGRRPQHPREHGATSKNKEYE